MYPSIHLLSSAVRLLITSLDAHSRSPRHRKTHSNPRPSPVLVTPGLRRPCHPSGSPMAGTACLATAEELTKLTRNPLETLCARFAVDHGLSGKPKGTLVQRLVALKQVTVAHVAEVSVAAQAAVRSPARAAAAPRPRKQSSMQAATDQGRVRVS